ncbi:MAG: type II toxin-antitoxin system RatA family toxin [Alphaproteobacteria bacterium]|nr:type II toxin-antitoxin system RatA family toxin [Alphaproteobacteria bacterium]
MPRHAEKRIVPYTAQQMFELVADIEKYPTFLPWCLAARIHTRQDDEILADLIIGYKIFKESFTSRVALEKFSCIEVTYQNGPLKYLNNCWKFKELEGHCCEIDFYVDFSFKSSFFESAITMFFSQAAHVMIKAFEERACKLYRG